MYRYPFTSITLPTADSAPPYRSRQYPSLTTIDHPRVKLGRQAVEVLCELIAGEPPTKTERVLPTKLVIRESCGAHIKSRP